MSYEQKKKTSSMQKQQSQTQKMKKKMLNWSTSLKIKCPRNFILQDSIFIL